MYIRTKVGSLANSTTTIGFKQREGQQRFDIGATAMPKFNTGALMLAHAFGLLQGTALAAVNCAGTFKPISASEYVAAINPGWNLGNTLDAIPDEGSWNNPPVQAGTFTDIKAAGFQSVRIPGRMNLNKQRLVIAPNYTIQSLMPTISWVIRLDGK